MNKEEAVNNFVKHNLSFLTSPNATSSLVKKMRLDFTNKMNLKSDAFFKNKDLAEAVIYKVTKIKKEEVKILTKELMKIPFISDELTEDRIEEIIIQNTESESLILKPEDLSQIQHKEYLKSIEAQFEENAKKKVEEELKEQKQKLDELIAEAEKDREFLKKFKSELDQLPMELIFEEKDLKIETKAGVEETAWWKQIGLLGNPFPSDEGLIGIPKDLYDQIVVRTKFVNLYLTRAEKNPEEFLGQSIVITGEFGSGKTTLLNMIRYKLGVKGILPCKIIIIPSPDADAMTNELLKQLGNQLCKIIVNRAGIDKLSEYNVIDSLSKLGTILEEFKKYEGQGLLIAIDGLHKGTKYFPQTLEFLQQIQNIHEFIEQEEVKCGFIIAGSLFWEKEIEGAASLSGSISKINIIPVLTEEDAVEAVTRRIHSFSPPGKFAPVIKRESIRIAFRTLQQRTEKPITFRSFMNHIRDRLIIGNYDEVGISISSYFEIIEVVKNHVKSSELGNNFITIEKEILKFPNLQKIIREVLLKIYQWKGVEESNGLFKNYMKVFSLLRTQGFIVQRRSHHGGTFAWSISPKLAEVLAEIQIKYSIPAEDALSCIFESKKIVISKEKDTIYSNLISKITLSATSVRDSWPRIGRLLEETKEVLNKLEKQITSENISGLDSTQFSETCRLLISCVAEASGLQSKDDVCDANIMQNLWCAPDNVDEIIEFCESISRRTSSESEIFGIMHYHAGIMEQLIDLLSQLTQGEGITRLVNRRLINEDMRSIHKARTLFINQSFRDVVDIVSEILEEKVRDIGFVVIRAIWGEKFEDIIPPDIRKDLNKIEARGHPRTKRLPDINFFYDISRSEYSKILFQKQCRRVIFGDDITTAEFDQMRNIWELAFSLGDRQSHRDKKSYFREHATEVGDVLRALPSICERFLMIAERYLHTLKFSYEKSGKFIVGKFPLEGLASINPQEISIDNKNAQRTMRTILSSIERHPREAIPLSSILITEGELLENQIALTNAMINRGLMNLQPNMVLEITEKGKEALKKFVGEHDFSYEV
jgi:hypothetical protein